MNRDVQAAATWFHDIGRPLERIGEIEENGGWTAEEAQSLRQTEAVSVGRIDAIEHYLRAHRIREHSPEPETIEVKLLFDADKFDAAGAVGIVRLAAIVGERSGRSGEQNAIIDDKSTLDGRRPELPDIDRIQRWARDRLDALDTATGRRLGESRWDVLEHYFDQLSLEIDPKNN